MKEKNWSYLAGLIDGEGYIGITVNNREPRNGRSACTEYQPRITIVNTSVKLMKYLISRFGGVYYSRQKVSGWKLSYNWEPKGARNKELLLLGVIPYLQVKREQALLVLEYLQSRPDNEHRELLRQKVHALNQTGDSVETDTPNTPSE